MLWYILDQDRNPVAVSAPDMAEFLMDCDKRIVAHDKIGDAEISTVFLPLEHRISRRGPPLLFETMIFGGRMDGQYQRSATWAKAEITHRALAALIRRANLRVV